MLIRNGLEIIVEPQDGAALGWPDSPDRTYSLLEMPYIWSALHKALPRAAEFDTKCFDLLRDESQSLDFAFASFDRSGASRVGRLLRMRDMIMGLELGPMLPEVELD